MLWLHVGPPKTGSSAFQAYLRERRDDLSRAGVFYAPPSKEEAPDGPVREVGNGVELGWWLGRGRPPARFSPSKFEEGFRQQFVSEDHPISLISSELIASAEPQMLERLRDGPAQGLQVGVIGMARDVYGHALSSWMHAVKQWGSGRDFEGYCRQAYSGPGAGAFRNLSQVFGRERVRLVHYDAVRQDIVEGLFGALGVTPPQPTRSPVANRGLSPVELAVAAACNKIHRDRHGLSLAISRHIVARRPAKGADLPFNPQAAAVLADRFGEETAWINETFFEGRDVLRIAPEPQEATVSARDVPPEQVWREVVEALVQRLDQQADDTRRAQAEVLVLRAMEKRRRGEGKAARRLARSAAELDPDNADAKALLAKLKDAQSVDEA